MATLSRPLMQLDLLPSPGITGMLPWRMLPMLTGRSMVATTMLDTTMKDMGHD